MRIDYDKNTDTLKFHLNAWPTYERDKIGPGVIADFSAQGSLVALEVCNASTRIDHPALVDMVIRGDTRRSANTAVAF